MTRFQIAVIDDETIHTSIEFNGSGYWDGYGESVFTELLNIFTVEKWKEFVTEFNSTTFRYEEDLHYSISLDDEPEWLDMKNDYYSKWFSDYIYIKNVGNEDVEFKTREGTTILESGESAVFYFGSRINPGTDTVYKTTNDIDGVFEKIRDNGWSVEEEDDNTYRFGKYSPAGQDFSFAVDIGEDLEEFADNVEEYYDDFDVSYETYLWLDSTGHGSNGAPYDMKDLYEDMETCREYIYELYELIKEEM